jgi:hypothetical protein
MHDVAALIARVDGVVAVVAVVAVFTGLYTGSWYTRLHAIWMPSVLLSLKSIF